MDSSPPRDPQGLWGHQQTISLKTNWFLHPPWFTLAAKLQCESWHSFLSQTISGWCEKQVMGSPWDERPWDGPLTAFLLPSTYLVLNIQHWGLVSGVVGIAFSRRGEWLVSQSGWKRFCWIQKNAPYFPLLFWFHETQVLCKQWGWRNTSNLFCGWKLHE